MGRGRFPSLAADLFLKKQRRVALLVDAHLRPSVELEHNAEDPVLLGGGLGHDPLRHLELHRHHRPPHALVVVTEGEQNLRSPREGRKQEKTARVSTAGKR